MDKKKDIIGILLGILCLIIIGYFIFTAKALGV